MTTARAKYAIERVTWIDPASDSGWNRISDLDGKGVAIETVGYVVKETKASVCIATSVSEFGKALDPITIPKVNIQRRTRLRCKGKR